MQLTPKQARRLKDLTTSQVAEELEISRWTYEKLEKNPDNFTIKQAKKFCKLVGKTPDQIFFAQNDNI